MGGSGSRNSPCPRGPRPPAVSQATSPQQVPTLDRRQKTEDGLSPPGLRCPCWKVLVGPLRRLMPPTCAGGASDGVEFPWQFPSLGNPRFDFAGPRLLMAAFLRSWRPRPVTLSLSLCAPSLLSALVFRNFTVLGYGPPFPAPPQLSLTRRHPL